MLTIKPTSDLQQMLAIYKQGIETELAKLLAETKAKYPGSQLNKAVEYSVLDGGKRLRPILSLISAEAITGSAIPIEENPALGVALAVELIHCGSLIHDDLPCMDDDDLRRGRPSNHKQFGEATALLTGDFLLAYPIEVLTKKTPQSTLQNPGAYLRLNEATLKFSQAIQAMIFGQSLDMELKHQDQGSQDRKQILHELQELKTGALLTLAVEAAAILSGVTEEQIQGLKQYALNLGKAFQIVDDILDCSADAATLGKSPGKDIAQHKLTFVSEYGMEESQRIAENLISEAIQILKQISIYPDKLELVARYVISRTH
jgi:geranylgeranyl pyrophosphate synthase